MRRAHGYIEGVGRLRLHYRTFEPDRPRAALLVAHGLFEHSRRYEGLANHMAGHGYASYILDHRGHGQSEGRRGHVRSFSTFLQDLDRFRREVRGLVPPGLPTFLVAHSLGGLIALRYLEEYDAPFHGAVISSPWLGTAAPVPRWQRLAARVLNRLLPAFPFPFDLDPNLLTHDPERVRDYRDDPLIHSTITPRLFTEVESAIEAALHQGDRIHLPVLFLLAGDDRVVDTARSLDFARAIQSPGITIRVLEGYYHEVLQEHGRAAVMAEVRSWIGAQLR